MGTRITLHRWHNNTRLNRQAWNLHLKFSSSKVLP